MPLIDSRFRTLFAILFAVFALYGTSMTIIGATLPKILADFQWSYLAAGFVIGAGAVTYFLSTFAAGYLVKHWGPKTTILLGLNLNVAGLAFFATMSDPFTNTLLSALIGLGQGCVEIGVNWSILRMDTQNTGRPMNLMHGAFAIGAIVGPLTIGLLMQYGFEWIAVYRGMGVIFGFLVCLVALLPMSLAEPSSTSDQKTRAPVSTHPAYWLSFFALFFYVGVELGISNWVAEYFVAVFLYPTNASALLVSFFWAGLLTGRFGVPLLHKGQRQERTLVVFSILATIAVISLALLGNVSHNPTISSIARVLVFLAGLGCSIYYPAIMTLLGSCFPHAQSQVIGFAATGGGIGAFVFPFLMSALSQRFGIRAGFATYAVFAVAMTTCALMLAVVARRKH